MMDAILLVALGPVVQVEEKAAESVWSKVAQEHIDGYELTLAANPDQPFERVESPVTQHVQSVRGNAVGSVYVWRDQTGRPVAVCDVFFLPRGGNSYGLYDEWHSLTPVSMIARWNGTTRWSPQESGLKWAAIPESAPPAESQARRNLQLRQLSRRFTASIDEDGQQRYELRMLPTPIFTFQMQDSDESLGGGLFAFCQGNDPEVLLLIEARIHDDETRWEYSVAEFSNRPQFLSLDSKLVWAADPPRFSGTGKHTGGQRRIVTIPRSGDVQ